MRSRSSITTSVVAIAASLFLSLSTNDTLFAFSPPAQTRYPHLSLPQSSEHPRPTLTTSGGSSSSTRLELSFIDTTAFFLLAASSAIDSSSQLNSNEGLAEAVGTLALLSSVGMGIFGSKVTNPNWKYEYKTGKNGDHVATASPSATITTSKEETKQSILTPIVTTKEPMLKDAKEVVVAKVEPITTSAVAVAAVASGGMVVDKKSDSPVAVVAKTMTPPPPPVMLKPPPVVPEQGKASIPSKEILQSTEIAKVEVQKVGVAETKERMSTKSSAGTTSSSQPPLEEEKQQMDNSSSPSTDVAGAPNRSRGKKTVKGLSLLVAAGVVALARNVIKAYLGKGML